MIRSLLLVPTSGQTQTKNQQNGSGKLCKTLDWVFQSPPSRLCLPLSLAVFQLFLPFTGLICTPFQPLPLISFSKQPFLLVSGNCSTDHYFYDDKEAHSFLTCSITALIVLDERRIQANRSDCCLCVKVAKNGDWESDAEPQTQRHKQKTLQERFMKWYARQLLRPWTKALVIVGFLAYAALCAYSTSLLTQEFNFSDLLPADYCLCHVTAGSGEHSSRNLSKRT